MILPYDANPGRMEFSERTGPQHGLIVDTGQAEGSPLIAIAQADQVNVDCAATPRPKRTSRQMLLNQGGFKLNHLPISETP